MKKSLICFVIVVASLLATELYAQREEPVLLTVRYRFQHRYNRLYADSLFTREAVLLVGKTTSRYMSWYSDESLPGVRIMKRREREQQQAAAPAGRMITVTGSPMVVVNAVAGSFPEFIQHSSTLRLTVIDRIGVKTYSTEGALPMIKWQVSTETKKIGSYECQKATGVFGGRDYEAWFAPGLSFGAGPWKLQGLPGVVLEARDSKGDVRFDFVGIERIEGALVADADDKWLETSVKELDRLKRAWDIDPASVVQGQVGGQTGTTLRFMDVNGKSLKGEAAVQAIEKDKEFKKSRDYNPLELPQQ